MDAVVRRRIEHAIEHPERADHPRMHPCLIESSAAVRDDHAACLAHWLELKSDKRAIFQAAAHDSAPPIIYAACRAPARSQWPRCSMSAPVTLVRITCDLTDDQAWQLAQFVKRITFSDVRTNATSDE
jgi:hypothetical protein